MKLISWNVNGVRAVFKKGLSDFLTSERPDIFCIQETKCHFDQIDASIHSLLDMKSYWSSAAKKGYSGTSTYVKSEPLHVEHGIGIEKFDSEGRFVVTHHKDFILYNVYFPNGARGPDRHAYKMDFLRAFYEHLKIDLQKGREVILVGDYNIAPTAIDIYDPVRHAKTSGFLPEEREWYAQFLELGFIDTFRYLNPEARNRYSWWNQMERARVHNRGWRIDMICISKGLLPRLVRADILDQIEGSDHCPTLIELKDQP